MTTAQDTRVGTYEAMFLVSQSVASDFAQLVEHINHLFERAGATVLAMKKWDERRLAYEIDKQKRGIYILAYFSCPTDMLGHLERDAQISEQIMRLMIVKADHLTQEEIEANDDRQGLSDEAKLRAQQGDQDPRASSGARLGAPEKSRAPDASPATRTDAAPEAAPEAQPEPNPDAGAGGAPKADAEG